MKSRALLLPCSLSMLIMTVPAMARAPISREHFNFLIHGNPQGWVPGNLRLRADATADATARVIFISGKEQQLPVKTVTVDYILENIKGERLPVVLKYHLQISLDTGVPGAMAFLNVNLPPKDIHDPLPEGYAFKGSQGKEGRYANGILTYKELTEVFEAGRSIHTDETVAQMHVNPLLSDLSRVSLITTRQYSDGRPAEVVTHAEMVGPFVADPVSKSMHRKMEWDPKELEAQSPYALLTNYVTVTPD